MPHNTIEAFNLEGKVALVTGAARGLGQAMAIGLAEAGAKIILVDINPCEETKRIITDIGSAASVIVFDMLEVDTDAADDIIQRSIDCYGSLDILVNNAGIIRREKSENFSQSDWQDVMQVNLNAAFYLSQAAGRFFLQQKVQGKIINIASMLSYQGGYMVPSYTAAKSAIAGITKALANEWAMHGINVNAVAPGYYSTEVTAGIRTDEIRNKSVLERIPAGRYGDPDDLKGIVVFLASAASAYIHGTIVPVDGGWLGR